MPDRFSGDRAMQAPGQRSSEQEPMDQRKAADETREHAGVQSDAAAASARSGGVRGAKAWREGKQSERASERSSTPRQSALAKLESMLARLDKPWTILREKETGGGGRALGVAFVGFHPEKGIALIDVEPARPSHAVAGLRVALLRAQNAGFTVREPRIVPVVLSRDEIPNFAARIEAAFAEMPRCAIQNRDWPDLAVASLAAEHPQLALLERRSKAAPPSAPPSSKPETARRAEPPPTTVQREAPQGAKDSGAAPEEARPAAAPRRDFTPSGEARRANGSSAYPSLLRRPDIQPPHIDSSQLDMSPLMRNLKPRRVDTQSRPEPGRPTAREQPARERPDRRPLRVVRDASSDGSVPPPPKARVVPMDRLFDPEWQPTYPPSRGRGRGWTIAGALCVMLAVLVVLPPRATGPGSSIRSTADAPAQHSDSAGAAAVQPPRFATGQGSPFGERPDLREPAPAQDHHAAPPAPATVDIKPLAAPPAVDARPAPDANVANAAKAPTETRAPSKAASAEGAGDHARSALTKPAHGKPPSASARPSPAARKSAPKASQKTKDLQEANSGLALPPPAARKRASMDDKNARDSQDTSGEMKYVEGREPRILGTITSSPSADGADAPQRNEAPQGNTDMRPASRGPLSPATDFSITPEGVMAPSGVVMPFDRQ